MAIEAVAHRDDYDTAIFTVNIIYPRKPTPKQSISGEQGRFTFPYRLAGDRNRTPMQVLGSPLFV